MATFEIGAFTEQELLDQGTAGTNIGYGDVFTMPATTSVVMDVYDNDSTLSGDSWYNENANDQTGQTATITVDGSEISSGSQIYAECYHWVQDQNGNWFIMIEIESEDVNGDFFTFYGDAPAEGSVLTVKCAGNVRCNWVTYDCLMEPNGIAPPLANDDAASVSETETATLNVLNNDVDVDGDFLEVSAVEGGTVGQPFEVNSSEGYSAMVTLNADGSLTVVPGPEFTQMAEGETTTISFDYTITDADGLTSTATVTVEVNGETTLEAADDAIIVSEDEGAGDMDGNVLENDEIDGVAYTGEVSEVNAEAGNVGTWVEGSNGGRIKINADGTFDFDADGDFDALDTGESEDTTFTYQISETGEVVPPHNILFVFDISNSTVATDGSDSFSGAGVGDENNDGKSDTVLDAQIAAAKAVVADLLSKGIDPATVNVGITTFSGVAEGYTDVDSTTVGTFSLNAAGLVGALESIQSGGWTNYEAGLGEAQNWFADNANAGDENVMYFLSDGRPITGSGEQTIADYGDELAAIEANFGASIHAIGVGANSSLDALNEIDNTGGAVQVLDAASMEAELLASHDYVVAVDTATVTVTVEGKTDYVAVADTMTVFASEAAGDADLLDSGAASVLENDAQEDGAYTGSVEGVNNAAANIGVAVAGTNGGLLTINADGSVDFDANGEFDNLLDGQSDTTSFTYDIADGKTASVTVTVNGETVRAANDDVMTVSESETFGDADLLDSGEASVLANDTQNGGAYTDVVGSVNGALGNVNTFVAGSNGGLLKVNADGSVDFDANGAFEALTDGQTAQTTFTYTLISGEEATVTVNVNGETDYAAADDVLTVMESETSGDLETLDDGSTSILTNDTQDGATYGGNVEMVEGAADNVGMQVTGSNGGMATINADGSIDFDANDEFDYLADGETATTTFSYEIAGGETANVTVNVLGEDDVTSGGEVLNLAIMMSSAATMYATAQGTVIGVPAYPDVNGDGMDNQLIDMAYLMLNDFMSDAFDVAAAAGVELNVSLISFGGNGNGEGNDYWSVNNAASWDGQLQAKVSADDSSDYGEGFSNANAWFDTVSTATSTNAVFVIGDGFTTGDWVTDRADLVADHGVEIDAYFPDLDIGSAAGVGALNLMDSDGIAEQVFTDDAGLAGSLGSVSALDVLDINNLIA